MFALYFSTKILSTLSSNAENNTDRIRQIALRFESQVYAAAGNKNEYYQIISNKINSITDKNKMPPANGHHGYANGGASAAVGAQASMYAASMQRGHATTGPSAASNPSNQLLMGRGLSTAASSAACGANSGTNNTASQSSGVMMNVAGGTMHSMYASKPMMMSSGTLFCACMLFLMFILAMMSPPAPSSQSSSSMGMSMAGIYAQSSASASAMTSKNPFVPNPQQLLMNTLGKTAAASMLAASNGASSSAMGATSAPPKNNFSFLAKHPAAAAAEKEPQNGFGQKQAELASASRYTQDYNPFIPHFSSSSKAITPLINAQQHKQQPPLDVYGANSRLAPQCEAGRFEQKNDKFIDIVAPTPSFFPTKPMLIHEQKAFQHPSQQMANAQMSMGKMAPQTAASEPHLPNLLLDNEEKAAVNRIVESLKMYIPKVDSLLSICVKIGVPTEPLKKFCNLKNILLKQLELSKKDAYFLSPHMAENLSEHLKKFIDILLKKINEHPNASMLIAQYKAGLMGSESVGGVPPSSQAYASYASNGPAAAYGSQEHAAAASKRNYEFVMAAGAAPPKKISTTPIIKESPFKFKASNPFGGTLAVGAPAPVAAPNSAAKSFAINEAHAAKPDAALQQSVYADSTGKPASNDSSNAATPATVTAPKPSKTVLSVQRKEPPKILPSVAIPTAAYVKSTLKESESFPLKYLQTQAEFLADYKLANKSSSPAQSQSTVLEKAVDLIKPIVAAFLADSEFTCEVPAALADSVFDGNQIEDPNFFDYDCLLQPHDIAPFAVENSL